MYHKLFEQTIYQRRKHSSSRQKRTTQHKKADELRREIDELQRRKVQDEVRASVCLFDFRDFDGGLHFLKRVSLFIWCRS